MAQNDRVARSRLRLEHLWPLTVIAGVFIFASTHPIRPHDFWWHLKAGQEIVVAGVMPLGDTFSHTMAGVPYGNYASYWLMEAILFLVYAAGGPALIVFFQALLVTATYGLLLWLCQQQARNWRLAAAATFFAVLLGYGNWNVRPQTLAFPAGVAILAAIYAYRSRPRRAFLVIPPVALLLWVNSHGSFVIGLVLLGLWLADEMLAVARRRASQGGAQLAPLVPPALTLLASGLACLANPRGAAVISYVTGLSSNAVIRSLVTEWAPPSFAQLDGLLFFAAFLLVATLLAASPRRPGAFQLLTFLAFGALALNSMRGVIWFGIVMAPIVAEHLAALFPQPATPRPGRSEPALVNYLFVALLAAGVVFSLPWFKHLLPMPALKAGLLSSETPVAATEVLLRERPPGPIFNELGFGSYLIWAAQPDYPVFVDTRLELYPLAIWQDYLAISAAAAGWEERLARYQVATLLLSPEQQQALVAAARRSPAWTLLYEDPAAALFTRAPGREP